MLSFPISHLILRSPAFGNYACAWAFSSDEPHVKPCSVLHVSVLCGIIVFAGLTAYDTQVIKDMAPKQAGDHHKSAIIGALMLYLDFINLFLYILRMMGRRK